MAHHYAVTAPNAEVLRQAVSEILESGRAKHPDASTVAIDLEMPCGERYTYRELDDIPEHSVDCRCGSPEHHVIFYDGADVDPSM